MLLSVFLTLLLLFCSFPSFSQMGKDGAKVITAANTVVNDYASLIADVGAGASSILVSTNTFNTNFATPLAAGDLIFIIQIQGAFIISPDDSTYGDIPDYLNCGNYEFAQVASVTGANTVRTTCGLQHSYISGGKVQVLRVPRYTVLTLLAATSITCPAWNGAYGGVVVVEVKGNTTINLGASIDASGKGFRPGMLPENLTNWGVLNWRSTLSDYGAEKGEGIGGSVADYDLMSGRFCKGAPGNGGGGGSAHNAGGGGGGNAGPFPWNGRGVPDISTASWANAWNLEYGGFAASSSSGGGKGGYSFSSANLDALTVGPLNATWGGDQRRDNGGRGGRPLDYTTGKLFLGGGGGAGDQNNLAGGVGGAGGGLVYIYSYADVTGTGQIISNGNNGSSTIGSNGTDGAGGGGAGGTIIINSTGAVSGISLTANGGNGGNQIVPLFTNEAEGPGGGGGGGYIAISSGAPTRTTNGGVNGTTNSFGLSEFTPNGATKGGVGLPASGVSTFRILTNPVNACYGMTPTLTFNTSGPVPIGIVYSWYTQEVGGTAVGTGSTYTTPPLTTSITYYVGSCPGFARFPIVVTVDRVTATYTSTTVCAGNPTTVNGNGTSTLGSIVSYNWDFGNGTGTGFGQSTTYTYPLGGSYTATLIVTDNFGCTISVANTITVNTSPVIAFTSSASGGCSGLNVSFNNTTTGATGYSWNFGDATAASTATSPSHTYASAGTYSVVLTATNAGGCTITLTQSITVGPRPTASFTTAITYCLNDSARFTNTSTGNGGTITGYAWNFGDGNTSTLTSPAHRYLTPGNYTVTLTTSSGSCTDVTTMSVTIVVAPVANFSTTTTSVCAPFTVQFTNASTGTSNFSWNFGNGNTSTLNSPSATYSVPGTYTVTLIAIAATCSDTLRRVNYIQVGTTPTASFSTLPTICLNDSARFANSSTGNGGIITSFTWNFGDGNSSSLTTPAHRYSTAGTFTVTLTATSGSCSNSTSSSVNVIAAPIANFSTSTTSVCGPVNVQFTNSSTGSTNFSWSFGDGNTSTANSPSNSYTTPGTYTITLIAIAASCPDTLRRVNYIQVGATPAASFTTISSICLNDSSRFTNSSTGNGTAITSYNWNFGDGNSSSQSSPVHLYSSAGTYTVTMTANASGCSSTSTSTVVVNPTPVAAFSASSISICRGSSITFTNTSTGSSTFAWTFGDGGTTSTSNPAYQYNTPGTYTITLTASSGSCSNTRTRTSYITVLNGPTASFSTSLTLCTGDSAVFANLSTGNGTPLTTYNWNFGDGNSSTQVNPRHFYSTAGSYSVLLTAGNGTCSDDTTIVVNVNSSPVVSFTAVTTLVCGQTPVIFSNTTAGTPGFFWNFGDGNSSSLVNPSHIYSLPGTYPVTLIASQGTCADTLTRPAYITVAIQPTSSFATNNVCLGDTAIFSNLSNGNGSTINSFTWNFGDGNSSSTASPRHYYLGSGNYSVTLTVSNGQCTDDTTISVAVNVKPSAAFSAVSQTGCANQTVSFINSTGGSPNYNWTFGDGGTSTLTTPVHAYALPGTYSVTLIVTQGSCVDTLTKSNYINISPTPLSSFAVSGVCLGDSARFSNLSAGNGASITSYSWDFGDGGIASTLSPAHYYSSGGNYFVGLTVSNGVCSDDTTIQLSISSPPVVSFTASTTTACDSLTVSFLNNSTGAGSYQWNFGDGNSSTSTSPSHTYLGSGTYSVLLTAYSSTGCSASRMQSNLIQIKATPVVDFSASNTSICPGDCISFTNLSSGNPSSLTWTFTGGSPSLSSTANPSSVCFSAIGNYTVTLRAANGACSSTLSKPGFIRVVDCASKPLGGFIVSDSVLCEGTCVDYRDLSSNATTWNWIFQGGSPATSNNQNPGGVCYSQSGNYNVRLIASNPNGSDTLDRVSFISVSPVPATPVFVQSGDTIIAPAGFVYQWYRNSVELSGATSQQYIATLSGSYTLRVFNTAGCSALSLPLHISLIGFEDQHSIPGISVFPNPAHDFIVIVLGKKYKEVKIEILDALGKQVISVKEKLADVIRLDLSNSLFSSGLYLLSAEADGQVYHTTIVLY